MAGKASLGQIAYTNEIVANTISLVYVICPDEALPAIGEIQDGTPHLMKNGSVKDEIIPWAYFTHPMYQEDNA